MTATLDPAFRTLADALAGEYTLESELGRGGMGVVFKARDVVLDRSVAVKVLPPRLAEDTDLRTRFLREARTAAQLSHPDIVPIYRADERAGFAFFVMQLVDGETLGERVRDRGPLPLAEAVRHLREVAWALAYAHARGVVHRDVKPDNIMIERGTGRALVTDFGIARNATSAGMTSEGHVVGTAHFMSPEQAQGTAVDGRSDLYALGVVGFFLLSGRLPFEGNAAPAVLVAQITRPAPALRSVAPRVPAPLADVIDRCLIKDPAARYATGEALADALGAALATAEATMPAAISGPQLAISEQQAEAVWKRAAQLQAEAAARLEREARDAAQRALSAEGITADEPTQSLPTRSYKVRDVEAAAVEAGISQRFVALALSELPGHTGVALAPVQENSTTDRVGTALLGKIQRSLSISRVVRAPARDVLKAIGRTFQSNPYRMTLRDQLGPHPLDGGIMVFKMPAMDGSGQVSYPFMWLVYGLGAKELRVTLRPLDAGATEVTAVADLQPGVSANVWGYGIGAGLTSLGMGAGGAVIGAKALLFGGAFIGVPFLVTAIATWSLAIGASRAFYRWEGRTATKELEDLLQSIDGTLRSRSIFDDDPPTPQPPRVGGDDGAFLAAIS
jgi:eukaryotic-like serine/threonine-protein kinase